MHCYGLQNEGEKYQMVYMSCMQGHQHDGFGVCHTYT